MKIRTLVSLACMGGMVHLPAQDQPKNGRPETAKHRASEAGGDTPKKKAEEPDKDIAKPHEQHPAAVSTLTSDELAGFDEYPAELQVLIEKALALTHLNLAYTFGGSTPADGGMDCSGTIDYLLTQHGIKGVPRSSDEICEWVREHSGMHLAPDGVELSHDAFSALRPGDLLFWTGTYETMPRKLPVSHIMIYLGTLKKTGKPVVFGASDGRYYAGQRRSGVSVFDFSMPRTGSKAAFYGYGTIPGLVRIWSKQEARKDLPPSGGAARAAVATTKPEDKADENPAPEVKKRKLAGTSAQSPGKKLKADDESGTAAKTHAAVAKPKPSEAENTPSTSHKMARSSEDTGGVAKSAGDAPEPAPHKHPTRRKSTVKKKPVSDDSEPAAVVHKAVDSIRKAFD